MPDEDITDIEYAPDGRIVDFLDGVFLEDRAEERVRQQYLRVLHFEYGYPKNVMSREVTITACEILRSILTENRLGPTLSYI